MFGNSIKRQRDPVGDRFIGPRMSDQEIELAHSALVNNGESSDETSRYADSLSLTLFGQSPAALRRRPILSIRPSYAISPPQSVMIAPPLPQPPRIEVNGVLDAPGIEDDFYQHPFACSNNMLFVALDQQIYSLNLDSRNSGEFGLPIPNHYLAMSCAPNGTKLLTAAVDNLQTWAMRGSASCMDALTGDGVRTHTNEQAAYTALYSVDDHVHLLCGYNGKIDVWDIRDPSPGFSFQAASTKICGIAKTAAGQFVVGDSDNQVRIWDLSTMTQPALSTCFSGHQAAVKAIACHPNKSLVATGGGRDCQFIQLWNPDCGNVVARAETGAQVTSLAWYNKDYFLSTHGATVGLWRHDGDQLTLMQQECRHGARILDSIQCRYGNNGSSLFSIGADEKIIEWGIRETLQEPPREESRQPRFGLR